jgi:flagellar hook-associated protein 1 FlgK
VIGGNAYSLDVSPNGLATISLAGVDVTSRITSGRIGGLLNVRDSYVPDYMSHLDALAFDLSSAVNAVHTTGYDADGNAAGNFFTPLGGPAGAASALGVDAALVADSSKVAASATGAAGDNAIALQLAAMRDQPIAGGGTRSPFGAWGQLVFEVGTDAAQARANAGSHTQVVKQLQQLQSQASGVSYDEEAANMMRYQRAYEANARYFQTILRALDSLMDMVH